MLIYNVVIAHARERLHSMDLPLAEGLKVAHGLRSRGLSRLGLERLSG